MHIPMPHQFSCELHLRTRCAGVKVICRHRLKVVFVCCKSSKIQDHRGHTALIHTLERTKLAVSRARVLTHSARQKTEEGAESSSEPNPSCLPADVRNNYGFEAGIGQQESFQSTHWTKRVERGSTDQPGSSALKSGKQADLSGKGTAPPAASSSEHILPPPGSVQQGRGTVCPLCGGAGRLIGAKGVLSGCPYCSSSGSVELMEDFDFDLLDEELDRLPIPRKGPPRKPLSKEHRDKIRQALKDNEKLAGVPKTEEHKQRISRAMRRANHQSAREKKSQALLGRAKTCSLCGETGHNRRSCPRNPANAAKLPAVRRCSVCGKAGHYKQRCPQLISLQSGSASQEALPLTVAQQRSSGAVSSSSSSLSVPHDSHTAHQRRSSGRRNGDVVYQLPVDTQAAIDQAVAAIVDGVQAGHYRQGIELLFGSGSDSADGWPGGIRQQFRAALPVVEALLTTLKQQEGLQGSMEGSWIDQTDCVGAWKNTSLAAVLFPTAACVDQIRSMTAVDWDARKLVITINPQWNRSGQVVSDFGFGQTRRDAERFIDSFLETYTLRRVRVMGDEVLLMKRYPGQWQVYYLPPSQPAVLLSRAPIMPSYTQIMQLLKRVKGSRASLSWLERVLPVAWDAPHPLLQFYQHSSKQQQKDEFDNAPVLSSPQNDSGSYDSGSYDSDDQHQQHQDNEQEDNEQQVLEELSSRFGSVDIITGEAVRDVKLDPIKQLVRWLP